MLKYNYKKLFYCVNFREFIILYTHLNSSLLSIRSGSLIIIKYDSNVSFSRVRNDSKIFVYQPLLNINV